MHSTTTKKRRPQPLTLTPFLSLSLKNPLFPLVQKSLALEGQLLGRLLSRNAAQHRGSLHHKRALELLRLLRLLGEIDVVSAEKKAVAAESNGGGRTAA